MEQPSLAVDADDVVVHGRLFSIHVRCIASGSTAQPSGSCEYRNTGDLTKNLSIRKKITEKPLASVSLRGAGYVQGQARTPHRRPQERARESTQRLMPAY